MGLFKACDIRGVADQELADPVARRIVRAIGCKLRGKKVVVGGDVRISTPRLKAIVVEELAAAGCTVFDIGTVATPMFYYALQYMAAEGGVMVTASHNPAQYNGFKLIFGDLPVSEADIAEIEMLFARDAVVRGEGSVQEVSIAAGYIKDTAAKAAAGNLKVVLDAGNGAASEFAPPFFRRLGYDVVELFCKPDGRFLNRPPNPAIAENLAALAAKVRETGADIGIAFDGDGDRAAFVDETGRAVDTDDVLILLARHFLESKKGAVIYDAKCSMVVAEQIALAGGEPVMARAGHTFVKDLFLRKNAVFGGELSGHFFFCALGYDDGMFAGAQVAAYVEKHGRLSALIDAVPNYIVTPEYRIVYTADDKEAALEKIAARLAAYPVSRIDGVRVAFADGWGMIRASVTEPLFTLRFEAKSALRLQEIQSLLIAALPERLRAEVLEEMKKIDGEK